MGDVGATGPMGATGTAGATGAAGGVAAAFASFFGMPAGPGNDGPDDYPATIAISAAGPSVPAAGSAINFPRPSAPPVGGIVINNPGATQADNTEFLLPDMGTYRVTWHISVAEPAQWSLWIGDAPSQAPDGPFSQHIVSLGRPSNVGQATGTSQLVGDVVFATPFPGAVIQIRNLASPAAVTVTPAPGGTQAQAVVLIIERLA